MACGQKHLGHVGQLTIAMDQNVQVPGGDLLGRVKVDGGEAEKEVEKEQGRKEEASQLLLINQGTGPQVEFKRFELRRKFFFLT